MRLAARLSALAGALALLAAPAAASASTIAGPALGNGANGFRFAPELTLDAPGGYRLTVTEREGAVALTVMRRHGKRRLTATSYVARGTATPGRLQASFGRFGRISMRFRPSAAKPRLEPGGHCHGFGTRLSRPGVFVGNLRFHGEGGYLSVRVHRAKGHISHLARRCLSRRHSGRRTLIRSSGEGTGEIPYLAAQLKTATTSKLFLALDVGKKALFLGQAANDAGRVSIFRIAAVLGPRSAFDIPDALTGARVSPGVPFRGAGSYAAAADGSATWDGSLSVAFPGVPHLSLTEGPLEAGVGTIPPLAALFLLKGSQSADPLALAALERPSLLAALGSRR